MMSPPRLARPSNRHIEIQPHARKYDFSIERGNSILAFLILIMMQVLSKRKQGDSGVTNQTKLNIYIICPPPFNDPIGISGAANPLSGKTLCRAEPEVALELGRPRHTGRQLTSSPPQPNEDRRSHRLTLRLTVTRIINGHSVPVEIPQIPYEDVRRSDLTERVS